MRSIIALVVMCAAQSAHAAVIEILPTSMIRGGGSFPTYSDVPLRGFIDIDISRDPGTRRITYSLNDLHVTGRGTSRGVLGGFLDSTYEYPSVSLQSRPRPASSGGAGEPDFNDARFSFGGVLTHEFLAGPVPGLYVADLADADSFPTISSSVRLIEDGVESSPIVRLEMWVQGGIDGDVFEPYLAISSQASLAFVIEARWTARPRSGEPIPGPVALSPLAIGLLFSRRR